MWVYLLILGVSSYTVGNGALFWGLKYISSTGGSLLISFVPIFVLLFSILWLKEIPLPVQVIGMGMSIIGCIAFFLNSMRVENLVGICIILIGVVGFAVFHVVGRRITKNQDLDTIRLTAIPLGLGGGLLLLLGIVIEGMPSFTLIGLTILLGLALINTAIGYLIYNWSLQSLTAFEMSVILNLIPLFATIFAWIALGETIDSLQLIAIIIVVSGTILVQSKGRESIYLK
jgi:drug/metabolite transporter (DMT)-like permease